MPSHRNDSEYYVEQYEKIHCNNMIDKCFGDDVCFSYDSYMYFRVLGISKIRDTANSIEMFTRVYAGLCSSNIPFSFLLKGTGSGIEVHIGTEEDAIEVLIRLLQSVIPEFHITTKSIKTKEYWRISDIADEYTNFGICKGIPCKREEQNESKLFLDELLSGMHEKRYMLRIDAEPLGINSTHTEYKKWSTLLDESIEFAKNQVSYSKGIETVSYEKSIYIVNKFSELAEKYCEHYNRMEKLGSWIVNIRIATSNSIDEEILSGITISSLSGRDDILERMHYIEGSNLPFIDRLFNENLISGNTPLLSKYCNFYSSEELAVITTMPKEDYFGFSVKETVPFDLSGRENGTLSLGNIVNKSIITENEYWIDVNDFNRHCFVSGLTGSGKTNTIKSLIRAMRENSPDIKFLIIEPAKKEYWQLYNMGISDLMIYTVGDTQGMEYRINLFERVGNTPIQTHIDYVLAAFKASFIMYTPMPYVLERAIYSIYEDCGWNIVKNENKFGLKYPTLDDLYYKIPLIVDEMGYEDKIQQDLVGSLQARINSMRIGTKGKTLNVKESIPITELLNDNTIIELESIADDEVKAFIISIILTQLMEYRLQQEDSQKHLKHILLLEEAHRLLKNVHSGTGENADPRGNAVEFFCNMLAELRSKGQGFIIADQIPSKLAPDIVKNTNIKITHRIVDGEERLLIGNSMHMTEEQIEYLASLKQGYAAIYAEGDDRPKLVKAKYAGDNTDREGIAKKRDEILKYLKEKEKPTASVDRGGFSEVCSRCSNISCDGNKSVLILTKEIIELINKIADECRGREFNDDYMKEVLFMLKNDYFACVPGDFSSLNCFVNELIKRMNMKTLESSKFVNKYHRFVLSNFTD